jgi:hypothetical protein
MHMHMHMHMHVNICPHIDASIMHASYYLALHNHFNYGYAYFDLYDGFMV